MAIPLTSVITAQIMYTGVVAGGGSSSKFFQPTFYYRRQATVTPPTKTALDTIFQANVVVPMSAALNNRLLQTANSIRWMDDAEDSFSAFSHAVAGGVAGDGMSTINAAFLLFKTGLRGKFYRGGKHLYPMSEADATAGGDDVFNAAALARLATAAAAMLANLTDATGNIWTPVVFSRSLSQVKTNPTFIVKNDVNAVAVNHRIGVMRHRRVKSVY